MTISMNLWKTVHPPISPLVTSMLLPDTMFPHWLCIHIWEIWKWLLHSWYSWRYCQHHWSPTQQRTSMGKIDASQLPTHCPIIRSCWCNMAWQSNCWQQWLCREWPRYLFFCHPDRYPHWLPPDGHPMQWQSSNPCWIYQHGLTLTWNSSPVCFALLCPTTTPPTPKGPSYLYHPKTPICFGQQEHCWRRPLLGLQFDDLCIWFPQVQLQHPPGNPTSDHRPPDHPQHQLGQRAPRLTQAMKWIIPGSPSELPHWQHLHRHSPPATMSCRPLPRLDPRHSCCPPS